jgi:hypothetical protein
LENIILIFILLKSLHIDKFPLSLKNDSFLEIIRKKDSGSKHCIDLLREDISHFMESKFPDFKPEDVVPYISSIVVPDLSTIKPSRDGKDTVLSLPESDMHFRIIFYAPDEFVERYSRNPLSIQANKSVYKQFIIATNCFGEDPIVSDTIYCFCE